MSYAHYDSRYYPRSRHDTYYTSSRDYSANSRHGEPPSPIAREKLTTMRNSSGDKSSYYPSSYNTYDPRPSYDSYDPHPPRRSAAYAQSRPYPPRRRPTWPPSPSVEDETEALTKEALSQHEGNGVSEGEPPADTRGTIDQESLLDDIEPPVNAQIYDDRRFVLVSEPSTDDESRLGAGSGKRDGRRRSVAERGNMAPINTTLDEPPVFTERVSTPYAYTKPQKESTAPSPRDFVRSPDPLTPSNGGIPRSMPIRDSWESERDRNARSSRPTSSHRRQDSFSRSHSSPKNDVFEDSDLELENSTHLRTERKPARYSFVKSDLMKEDLKTDLRDSLERPGSRRDSGHRSPPVLRRGDSSNSPKDYPYAQSPRSSSSSLHGANRNSRPVPVDTTIANSSRTPSRPSSPLPRVPSPRLPTRLRESPPSSRPSSRGNPRPASPLSFSTTIRPPSPSFGSVTDADWHATYPPPVQRERPREPSRLGRTETMPEAAPRIDVHSPSPARPPQSQSSLPYPIDDEHTGIFMPPEHHYQFDHSTVNSPRQTYPDSPRASAVSIPGSPRLRDEPEYLSSPRTALPEEDARPRRHRSVSFRSQAGDDERREKSSRKSTPDLRKPLPICPRAIPSARYEEWYTLRGFPNFDICPTCFEGVFAETEFARDFTLRRREEVPRERYCDFNSPWLRLAWLMTVKHRRERLSYLYRLVDVLDHERSCPGDRELGTGRITWYGIPEQRDGLQVSTFAICACDKKMVEALFPSLSGYFTKIRGPATTKYTCSLRTTSRRFPKYLDLLVDIDADANLHPDVRPNMKRFVAMARDNAFKSECARDKPLTRKAWHFIPALPEFTVCEECFEECVWPALTSTKHSTLIPRMMNKAITLVSQENPEIGSSCCLYSPRMRRVWEEAVRLEDFDLLERKAKERKRVETDVLRRRREVLEYMAAMRDVERGSREWEDAKREVRGLEGVWSEWE